MDNYLLDLISLVEEDIYFYYFRMAKSKGPPPVPPIRPNIIIYLISLIH